MQFTKILSEATADVDELGLLMLELVQNLLILWVLDDAEVEEEVIPDAWVWTDSPGTIALQWNTNSQGGCDSGTGVGK